ncbi:MAG: DNA replication/repair protein RecF [Chitinophagales bacterium]
MAKLKKQTRNLLTVYLRHLKLSNYKNYRQLELKFQKHFILINGNNGSGKTNLMDAVHYLCLCKSFFIRQDALLVLHGENFFRLDGSFSAGDETFTITAKFHPDKKKEFFKNDVLYEKLSDHVGLIPVIMIAPGDVETINGGSEERRRFLDAAIGQMDTMYLKKLIEYNKILSQRNTLLKQFSEQGKRDNALLDVLNRQLAERGDFIFETRKNFIDGFRKEFELMYRAFSSEKEIPTITYHSQLSEEVHLKLLKQNTEKDIAAQRTTAGIHKDDLLFFIDGFSLKENGSQGQIKSFLISLKLVLGTKIFQVTQKKPILLLDDIFEKLDIKRLHVLFTLLKAEFFDQIFITDADEHRSIQYLTEADVEFQHIRIFQGEVLQ